MSKSIVRVACGLLIMLVIITGLAACGPMEEPEYASQITEDALQSINAADYATHVALYTPEVQSTITEFAFNIGCEQIKNLIGYYIDKEFQRAEEQNGYVAVEYKANFSKESGVIVNVYFQEIDGEMYIAGFDIPRLFEE